MIIAEPTSIPWEIIGGGGAALAVIVVVVVMLRSSAETMKSVSADFSATVKDANEKNKQNVEQFTDTTSTLVREARAAHEKCEETLHSILRDHLIPRPSRRTDP